jgi:hypothetical protein
MPFQMRVAKASDDKRELAVSGQLIGGAYFGPEAVLLCDADGQWFQSVVIQHEIELPKDWPVVPGDGSTLTLHIRKPSIGFKLDRSQLVKGQGSVILHEKRVDITEWLTAPEFWATWVPLHFDIEELPEPSVAWGVSTDIVNGHYELFRSFWAAETWPYVRFGIPGRGYVEIEFAAGTEHQNRVWVGTANGPRVLLGYDSGHFSFPAFRVCEVLELAERMDGHPAAPLLLLPGAYLIEGQELPSEIVGGWVEKQPGFRRKYMELVLAELGKNVVSPLEWRFDEDFGWVNNWPYSQRNPSSTMSILRGEDFRFIQEFFLR